VKHVHRSGTAVIIIGALDTGMRRGEMLALRFADLDWKRRMLTLRGATTKSRRTRIVPIGTARLFAVMEWLMLDSAGQRKDDDLPVFSNEAGEPLKTFKKAWVVAVLKAHGVDPHWRKGAYKDLSTECQHRFRSINLHWHDLRHEYASRLVEHGVPLAQVRDLLGHASILTTERYDNQRLEALQAAVERLEGGKTFDPKTEATDKVSRIFQDPTEQSFATSEDPTKESATSQLTACKLEGWYRYGDSNPGPVAENHVS
jgi:integrase